MDQHSAVQVQVKNSYCPAPLGRGATPYTVQYSGAVASLGWVTPRAATEGVTPLFFPEKPGDLFLVASSAVSPLISSSQKLTTFFAHRFIAFYCFHSGVTPHLFYLSDLVSPLFFVNLPTKNYFPSGVTP